jgi:pilus assembly protein Flp/PilA
MLFLTRERGQSLVEYALILVLVAIAVMLALETLGAAVAGIYDAVIDVLRQEPPPDPEKDCYGSLLLPYLLGLTTLFNLVFRLLPKRPHAVIEG